MLAKFRWIFICNWYYWVSFLTYVVNSYIHIYILHISTVILCLIFYSYSVVVTCDPSDLAKPSLYQEREEAEALWAADGKSVVKKADEEDEEEDGGATTARNARSQAPKQKSRGRGRVTGGKDELWEAKRTWQAESGIFFYSPITPTYLHLFGFTTCISNVYLHILSLHLAAFFCKVWMCIYTVFIMYMMELSERNTILSFLWCQAVFLFKLLYWLISTDFKKENKRWHECDLCTNVKYCLLHPHKWGAETTLEQVRGQKKVQKNESKAV